MSGWRGWSLSSEQTDFVRSVRGPRPRTNRTEDLGDVRFVCRYGSIKGSAVDSPNLMERGAKFCTAEERVAGPNAPSEAVGSRSNSI
jgi:hypothetical protein